MDTSPVPQHRRHYSHHTHLHFDANSQYSSQYSTASPLDYCPTLSASTSSSSVACSLSTSSSSTAHYLHHIPNPSNPDFAQKITSSQSSNRADRISLAEHQEQPVQQACSLPVHQHTLLKTENLCSENILSSNSISAPSRSLSTNSTSDSLQQIPQASQASATGTLQNSIVAASSRPYSSPLSIWRSTPSSNHIVVTSTPSLSKMPPVTHCSTNLGSSPTWEPYPTNITVDRKCSINRPSQSPCVQFSPSALSSLKLPPASAPALLPCRTPVSPPLEDLELQEMSGVTVSELLQEALDVNGDKRAILLLDLRPIVCNALSTIKTAVRISVPNVLLKRPTYSLDMVTGQLTTRREIEAFSNWRQFSHIVFFDATGSMPAKGSPIQCIAQKFRKEGCATKLGYIYGGYNAFARDYPSLCCCSEDSLDSGQADTGFKSAEASNLTLAPNSLLSCSRLHLGSLPNMLARSVGCKAAVCQFPKTDTPNVNPLFESVSQAIGLNTNITEEVPIRLPPRISVERIRDCLPTWLLDAVRDNTGKAELAQRFQKVEVAEKKRLFMVTQEKPGKAKDLSICAGMEKGLKNRYNIYPFDQTRVKIRECEDGQDDYINASFLRPPFGHKCYIAAQGPLPSTFQDFWKVVWEQNSRVIVMLTREFEMGKIKCHRYWPTPENPVMDLGPLRVTFLNEYRPDTADDSILARQMQLSHLHYPGKSGRTITQIQYTGWPDFGVPETPIGVLEVIQLANEHNTSPSAGPMVVHCSAGCGRTGTFCVIDSVLAELKDHTESILGNHTESKAMTLRRSIPNDVVFDTVSRLREQRLCIVQCLRQYVFCYEAILWHLVVGAMRLQTDIARPLTTSVS